MWREKDDHNDTSAILKCFEFTSTWENISHQNSRIFTGIVIAYSESEKFIWYNGKEKFHAKISCTYQFSLRPVSTIQRNHVNEQVFQILIS